MTTPQIFTSSRHAALLEESSSRRYVSNVFLFPLLSLAAEVCVVLMMLMSVFTSFSLYTSSSDWMS